MSQEGLAGAYAGFSNGALLVAGGANFPGARQRYHAGHLYAHEGLTKTWHDQIYALVDDQWHLAGRLPCSMAYGLAFELPEGVLLVGGELQGGAATAAVHLMRWDGEAVRFGGG